MFIKSPLNYTGGKYKILAQIFELLPENIDTFVDLFSGGFNVGINVNANKIICNDHINYIIDLYRYLKNNDIENIIEKINIRINEFSLSPQNSEGYNLLRDRYNQNKDIIDFFVLTCYSFNHQIRFNNKHKFNTPFGKQRSSYNKSIEQNLRNFCTKLQEKNIEFGTEDFMNVNLSLLGKNDLVYCDPPYLISNGSYNDGKRGFKDWGEKEEKQLLNLLDSLDMRGVKFILSNVLYHKGLENRLLIEWSKRYNNEYIDKTYSNCSYQLKDRNKKTVEVLITNYKLKNQ